MKKLLSKLVLISLIFLLKISIIHAEEKKSLSTSGFVSVDYKSDTGELIKTCSGKKAAFAENYVSIGINKLTVNKNDPLLKRIFNTNRSVFGVSNLRGEYKSQPISISRIGNPVIIKGKNSSIDMGIEWGLLDRIPWVLKNASIEIKLGYAADSTTDSLIKAFSSVTSEIPDYTISTSLSAGFAITNAIDNLLFQSDRAINLLNARRDLPLSAGQLCEGHYAIFSAEKNDSYEKYYQGKLVWTGNDLRHNGKSINDVSYAVVSVRVTDKYYDSVESALNDLSRPWAPKYREIRMSFFDLLWQSNVSQLNEIKNSIRNSLFEARTLLSSDTNLIEKEIHQIHQFVIDDFIKKSTIAASRVDVKGVVTLASTQKALAKAINDPSNLLEPEAIDMAERLLLNPEANIPAVDPKFSAAYKAAILGTQEILNIQ